MNKIIIHFMQVILHYDSFLDKSVSANIRMKICSVSIISIIII